MFWKNRREKLISVLEAYAAGVWEERERQIGYLSKLCWSRGEIADALKWGNDEVLHADIEKQVADSKWTQGIPAAREEQPHAK